MSVGKLMYRVILVAILSLIGGGTVILAQSPLSYPSMHHYRYATDPIYQQLTDALEEKILRSRLRGDLVQPRGVQTIPVVVHVVHLPEDSIPRYGSSNPTDFQIRKAISWINEAFRDSNHFEMGPTHSNAVNYAKNNDGTTVSLDVDTYIEFTLAKSDPDSFPTTGILRNPSSLSNFELDGQCLDNSGFLVEEEYCLKSDAWDSKKYFNIWLVNSICQLNGENCQLEGFSYGGSMSGKELDGMVLETQYFDTTGRKITTAVHNIGHYLGLFDTYLLGCEQASTDTANSCLVSGDKVCDTPPDASNDLGNCLNGAPANTCSNDALQQGSKYDRDVEDLFENFMDGGNPICKNSFTVGQQARMIQTMIESRSELTNSHALQNYITDLEIEKISHPGPILCGNRVSPVLKVKNKGTRHIKDARIKFYLDEQTIENKVYTLNLSPGQATEIPIPASGNLSLKVYEIKFRIIEVNGRQGDANPGNNQIKMPFVTVSPTVKISNFPYEEDFNSGISPVWRKANLDEIVDFELFNNYPNCTENHGPGFLMYNSSGLWNNGAGEVADVNGTKDYFISPIFDFTNENQAILTFDFAHKLIGPQNELTLRVWAVRDCDAQPIKVFEAGGSELETSLSPPNPNLIGWSPQSCDEWKEFKVNLDTFVSTPFRIFFEAELNGSYTQNFYLDNISLLPTDECNVPRQIPTEPGIYRPTTFCTDSLGWTHYYTDRPSVSGRPGRLLLFSTQPIDPEKPVFIPVKEARMHITPSRDSSGHRMQGLAPYAENLEGWNVMSRYLRITEEGQPQDSFRVRFYYDEVDFNDLQRSISPNTMEGHDRLVFFSIQADRDADPSGGHTDITEADFTQYRNKNLPGPKSWTGGDHPDGFHYADFVVDHAYAIGSGTGGYGKGYGAQYPVGPKIFRAEQVGAAISVSWVTKREYLTNSFEVYYSKDSLNFQLLDPQPVPAVSYGSNNPYGVNQENPEIGKYYYYVKIIHEDGLELNSDTISAVYDPRKWINVFPNPASDFLGIKVNTEPDTEVSFGIYDGAGYRQLLSYSWQHRSDDPVNLDISSLPNGMFFYVIRFGSLEYRDKLIKLK